MINQDIRAKLRRRPEELARWELVLMNELRRALTDANSVRAALTGHR